MWSLWDWLPCPRNETAVNIAHYILVTWLLTLASTLQPMIMIDIPRRIKISLIFCRFDRSVKPCISIVTAKNVIFFCSCSLLKPIISCKVPFFFLGSIHHTSFILPSRSPTSHSRISDCAKNYTKTKHWCSYLTYFYNSELFSWASAATMTMTTLVPQSQSNSRWLQHCHNWGTIRRIKLLSNIFFCPSPCH